MYEEEQQSGCQLDGALRGEGGMAAICFFFYSEKHFDKKNGGERKGSPSAIFCSFVGKYIFGVREQQ